MPSSSILLFPKPEEAGSIATVAVSVGACATPVLPAQADNSKTMRIENNNNEYE
jgi:hypothetical protein